MLMFASPALDALHVPRGQINSLGEFLLRQAGALALFAHTQAKTQQRALLGESWHALYTTSA
jgi:hypothetical protein